MNILISIIVPIYNSEEYLQDCIYSIINQTYQHIEIILINDGSTDKSLDICNKLSKIDKRIIVINKENSGVSDTRNYGIKKSKGKYIMFVDSDDILDLNCCEILLYNMIKYNCDLSMANITRNKSDLGKDIINKEYAFDDKKENLYLTIYNNSLNKIQYTEGPYAKLYNKEIIINKKIMYDTDLKIGEDSLFNLEYYYLAKKIILTSKYLYYYRNNSNSVMNSEFEKYYKAIFKTIDKHKNKLEEIGLFQSIKNDFYCFAFRQVDKLVKKSLKTNLPQKNYYQLLENRKVKDILNNKNANKLSFNHRIKRILYKNKLYYLTKMLNR